MLMVAATAVEGGAEEILAQLAIILPDRGFDVEVAALRDGPLVKRLLAANVRTTIVESGRVRQPYRVLQTIAGLTRVIRRGGHDIVHANMATSQIYAGPAAHLASRPAMWTQTDVPEPPTPFDRIAATLRADAIVALSQEAMVAQRRAAPNRRVELVHPGVDPSRFSTHDAPELRFRYGISPGSPLVTIVGRLQPWKGQKQFIRAAARVRAEVPGCQFAVVGGAILGWEGNYPAELRALTRSLGLDHAVTFTGHSTEVDRWMAASDVVVNASAREPFGLVVLEAMASGCAMVAVDSGGPRDIITHMDDGVLCPSSDPGALSEAMLALVHDPELRARLGRAGRNRVATAFTPERSADAFAAVARSVLESQPGRHEN